jgi:hypothetical protein
MTFANIPPGSAIFLDANILVYHLTAHPTLGQVCTKLVRDIEQKIIVGYCSTHVRPATERDCHFATPTPPESCSC